VITPIQQQVPLGAIVAQRLRLLIVRGELSAGSRLVEDTLADQFGVSRGPIRDALRTLESEGLVEARKRGIFVVGLSVAEISDLYALRESIESLAVTLAIQRAARTEWQQADACVDEMRAAAARGDREAFGDADTRFHRTLYALSKHRRLHDLWNQYEPILATLLQETVHVNTDLGESAEDHERLLALIVSGDVESSLAELHDHLSHSAETMMATFRDGDGDRDVNGDVAEA
jgi:GntR family transcriptional regulator of gluconate operon